MKRFTQLVCLILIIATVFAIPVSAEENATPWGSNYFTSFLAYLHPTTGNQFQIWIEVVAVGTMDKLGASEIVVQRSSDKSNWTDMKTYTKEAYTNLVADNAFTYKAYVSYTGTSGYYYRAKVEFYAKKGTGSAGYEYTTDSIYLS